MTIYRVEDKVNLDRMRKERVERAREQMKKDGIGAYLCFQQGNIKYLTDTLLNALLRWFQADNSNHRGT